MNLYFNADSETNNIYSKCNDGLLTAQCSSTSNEALKSEREHTNQKLEQINRYNDSIFRTLIDEIQRIRETCVDQNYVAEKISNLEQTLVTKQNTMQTSLVTLEESIADVNLRAVTTSMYQDHLLHNLQSSLIDTRSGSNKDQCCPCNSSFPPLISPRAPTTNNNRTCTMGDKAFDSFQLLNNHVSEHSGQVFSCGFCEKTCTTSELLQEHLRLYHNIRNIVPCRICDHIFLSKPDLDRHINTDHEAPSKCLCYLCGKILPTEKALNTHLMSDHPPSIDQVASLHLQSFRCDLCGILFALRDDLQQHLECGHSEQIISQVQQTLSNPVSQEILENVAHPAVYEHCEAIPNHELSCNNCDKSFDNFRDLSEHVTSAHSTSLLFPCEDCDILFTSLTSLETHILGHHETIPQFDGPLQDVVEDTSPYSIQSRTAPYLFNKKKQLK